MLLFPEEHSRKAIALFADARRAARTVVTPYLLPVEVTNVVRKRMRRDRLTLAQALAALNTAMAFPIELLEPPDLHQRALGLTQGHSLGAHDAHYVALAQILGCDLWVDDGRLLRAVRGQLPFVKWIGDYEPAGAG